jgi:hypothetical protein
VYKQGTTHVAVALTLTASSEADSRIVVRRGRASDHQRPDFEGSRRPEPATTTMGERATSSR